MYFRMRRKLYEIFVTIQRYVCNGFLHLCILGLCTHELPEHIAYIVDGNRTFSKQHKIPLFQSYVKGMENIMRQIEFNGMIGVSALTFFLFSTHNNRRSKKDKRHVLAVIEIFLNKLTSLTTNHRYQIIGDVRHLPIRIRLLCNQLIEQTKFNKGTIINLAINYSGRVEIADMSSYFLKHKYSTVINKKTIDDHLYTYASPKLNLIIRTSGQKRLSDFLLWQSAETVMYFTHSQWPEFSHWSLLRALFFYQIVNKNFQKIVS